MFIRPAQFQTVDYLYKYMFTNGFQLKDGVFHSLQLVAFSYEDGMVFSATRILAKRQELKSDK
ncbi:MAG: hypothetical protein RL762_386 [Bacteroidota bacterium]|jgi:hypothetical protein